MSHLEYKGFKVERRLGQWVIWDEDLFDWIYLTIDTNWQGLKEYLDELSECRDYLDATEES